MIVSKYKPFLVALTLFVGSVVLCASSIADASAQVTPFATPRLAGLMTDVRLVEFSGMAPARRKNRFWAINDGGQAPILWQIDQKGKIVTHLKLENVENIDIEDLASFSIKPPGGARLHYVAVADIGDNAAVQNDHKIYIVPDVAGRKATAPDWTIRFRYPDGAHDAESLAVDAKRGHLYIVIKRVLPPILYRLPLNPASSEIQTAERIATLEGIPVNDQNSPDARNAVRFGSQPTGAVMGCDGNELLLLTYASVYRYQKSNSASWATALVGQKPQVLPLPPMFQAEAITLTQDCKTLYVGGEKVPGPLWRFNRVVPTPVTEKVIHTEPAQ
jgi:hypothetical protein